LAIKLSGFPFNFGGSTTQYGNGNVGEKKAWTTQGPDYINMLNSTEMILQYATATTRFNVPPANLVNGCGLLGSIIMFTT